MDEKRVAKKLAKQKISVSQSTIEYIIESPTSTDILLERILNNFSSGKITKKDIESISGEKYSDYQNSEEFERILEFDLSEEKKRKFEDTEIDIRGDITGESYGSGEIDSYIDLFRDRYKRMYELLEPKMDTVYPVNLINRNKGGEDISVIGIVNEVRDTQKGNKFIEFEDTKDKNRVVFYEEDTIEKCESVVEDEVVGIKGSVQEEGDIIFGDELYFPDLPYDYIPNYSEREVKAVLISDIHIGGKEFAVKKWQKFVNWVRQNKEIKYIVVAGDLVDGVGVYPEQEKELSVTSVDEQYDLCAKAFEQFPDDVSIIASPGNHDTPRLAEPQPQIQERYKEKFPDNVTMVGNPALVELEGVKIQIYHGMSIKPISDSIPSLDMEESTGAMKKMLQKRHLNPIYGKETRIAPEKKDYLIIDEIPDVLHSGHVHKLSYDEYRKTKIINSGCWQKRTEYQKQKNIIPDVGTAPILDLSNGSIDIKQF